MGDAAQDLRALHRAALLPRGALPGWRVVEDVARMSLDVYTARISCDDGDRLDITRKSGTTGRIFAPSWAILSPALEARVRANEERRAGNGLAAEDMEGAAWRAYVPLYVAEMRVSYRRHRAAWEELLERPRVVLVCYCTRADQCHRRILASVILSKCGAIDRGEWRG